ncbi:Uncharacterised protein [Mycobacteroides abscessus subsp. abscessus]|nr:Uncharacterised protein [Mycobacteroides abscessus subsp. abscessus]
MGSMKELFFLEVVELYLSLFPPSLRNNNTNKLIVKNTGFPY